ncbi:MAG: response regulator [Frankiaceae bacterium]|nr:response regulator [Frankiaceae bacterium]
MVETTGALVDGLVALATSHDAAADVSADAARLCVDVGAARGAAVYEPAGDSLVRAALHGDDTDLPETMPLPESGPVVGGWSRTDGDRYDVAFATGEDTVAVLATSGAAHDVVDLIAGVAGKATARTARLESLTRTVRHFSTAQRISHVGSYDFEIATNTNSWSDQLFRIYGREPQSFNASYEKFLEMVHPDDRETIIGVHQHALQTLSPYEMEERIVWPNGEVRTLASWGEVVAGPDGTPARMVGICWDITEQQHTASALARSGERFERLIQAAPDVVLVVASDGTILQANDRVRTMLGYDPVDVVGRPVTELLPAGLGPGGPPLELVACDRTGKEIPAEVSANHIETDEGAVIAAFVRDLRDRKRSEELGLRLHDADVRRRHALEINDNVVQGLASVLYLLDLERHASAHNAARGTMAAARAMMNDLLADTGPGALSPGELVRERGHVGTLDDILTPQAPPPVGALRVVLADDAEDIRLLLRLSLSTAQGFDVVAEAGDGETAVDLVQVHQPDVILLDLSMPVMDGLQAIPEIQRLSPRTKIVILSGFDETRMRPVAMELGATAYLEKGEAMNEIVQTLVEMFPDHPLSTTPTDSELEDSDGGLAFDGDMVVHELRTPLTVITGMLSTLRDRMDVLPSATTHELLQAATRNARQMAELLDAVSDARRAEHGLLPVHPEPTDLGTLVRDAVADLCAGHNWLPPTVTVTGDVMADADPMRVRQVLTNLLSNAYKFSPAGTPVTVTVHGANGTAEITVHDEGPGIPPDRRHELFSKFGRLGQTGHGMGLGLYISREIARSHGGELELRDGPGATFALTLPRAAARDRVEPNGH